MVNFTAQLETIPEDQSSQTKRINELVNENAIRRRQLDGRGSFSITSRLGVARNVVFRTFIRYFRFSFTHVVDRLAQTAASYFG